MALAAHLQETAGKRAREPRRTIRLAAQGALASGKPADVTVHNISATGMLIACAHPLALGEILAVDLPDAKATRMKVVWESGNLRGCEFTRPLARSVLSAAVLRSAVGGEIETQSNGEPFGLRLQRLREARGLSLSHIANEIGVSKPTVWAWEHGRARPVEQRLDALAAALGVAKGELVTGRDERALEDVLVRGRRQIAEAYGVAPERVRIMIDL